MRDDVVGLDCSILMHPLVWKASGHADKFADLVTECKKCNTRTRVDHLRTAKTAQAGRRAHRTCRHRRRRGQAHDLSNKVCPNCGAVGQFTEPMPFKLMFETQMGANVDDSMTLYLRPETAQGIFANFRNVLDSTRVKVPFGIAQIGKSFRNEVTTKAFIFRTREFEQAELEFFCEPGTDDQWYEHWKEQRCNWYLNLGHQEGEPAVPRPRQGRAGPLRQGAAWMSNTASRSAAATGRSSKASPTARTSTFASISAACGPSTHGSKTAGTSPRSSWPTRPRTTSQGPLSYLRRRERRALHPLCDRALAPAWTAARWRFWWMPTTRKRSAAKRATSCASTRPWPRSRPAIFPLVKKEGMPEIARNIYDDLKRLLQLLLRRKRRRRPPLSPPGRGGHAVLHHRRRPDPPGPDRHRPRARLHGAGPHRHQPAPHLPVRQAGPVEVEGDMTERGKLSDGREPVSGQVGEATSILPVEQVQAKILMVRGQRVILDAVSGQALWCHHYPFE